MPILVGDEPPLVEPEELEQFPGAPFDPVLLAVAAGSVRGDAGWHIAPRVEQTFTLDGPGTRHLFLPTLHMVELLAVTENGRVLDPASIAWSAGGYLEHPSGWTTRLRGVEVTISHGYVSCPDELLAAIAYRAQQVAVNRAQGAVRLGSLSISPAGVPNTSVADAAQPDKVIERYRIPSPA